VQLPVSELEVRFRVPDGNDDLAILEAPGGVLDRALLLVSRLALLSDASGYEIRRSEETINGWASLTVTDFEAALLSLRRFLFGDTISCVFRCTSLECGERIEPEFSVTAYLEQIQPRLPRHVSQCENRAGWYRMSGGPNRSFEFRLPTVMDQLRVLGRAMGAAQLTERCIEPIGLKARGTTSVEQAMESLAPLVSQAVTGSCPECGESLTMYLHVPRLVVDELTASAVGVHDEIHSIAAAYHWDEAAILALPQRRRQAYAETIRRRERAA